MAAGKDEAQNGQISHFRFEVMEYFLLALTLLCIAIYSANRR